MENVLEKFTSQQLTSYFKANSRESRSDLIRSEIASMKFSPIVSVDVQKSFSVYTKHNQRSAPTTDGRKFGKIMITHAFYNRNYKELFESLRYASIFF